MTRREAKEIRGIVAIKELEHEKDIKNREIAFEYLKSQLDASQLKVAELEDELKKQKKVNEVSPSASAIRESIDGSSVVEGALRKGEARDVSVLREVVEKGAGGVFDLIDLTQSELAVIRIINEMGGSCEIDEIKQKSKYSIHALRNIVGSIDKKKYTRSVYTPHDEFIITLTDAGLKLAAGL